MTAVEWNELLHIWLIVCPLVFLGGLVDAVAGGGGLITLPAYLLAGLPPHAAAATNKCGNVWGTLLATGRFTLSVLSEKAEFSTFQRFGFQSGRDVDKLEDFQEHIARDGNGVVYVTQGTNAWLSCQVVSTMDLGTHTLFVADVLDGGVLSQAPSATYSYYQSHIKPKPAAPAGESSKKRWVCTVCGYVYEGEELPADFICPLCKHPASDFELLK